MLMAAWENIIDPGHHCIPEPDLTTAAQYNTKVIFQAEKYIYNCQQNLWGTLIAAMNTTILPKFKQGVDNMIGVSNYKQKEEP